MGQIEVKVKTTVWRLGHMEVKGMATFMYEGKVTWKEGILRIGAWLPLCMRVRLPENRTY